MMLFRREMLCRERPVVFRGRPGTARKLNFVRATLREVGAAGTSNVHARHGQEIDEAIL
jgi:hypothetical protein